MIRRPPRSTPIKSSAASDVYKRQIVSCNAIWPSIWMADFNGVYINNVTQTAITAIAPGTFWYDARVQGMRNDFQDPQVDWFCAGIPGNGVCSQIFNSDGLFIVYPEDESCCFCCSAKEGCGALSANWTSQGVYQGSQQMGGSDCDAYLIQGGSANYYYETSAGVPCELNNGMFNIFLYDQSSFNSKPVTPSQFDVSSNCMNTPCKFQGCDSQSQREQYLLSHILKR
eukprot:TRINITY_DN205_c0_g1_i3.p1 TRINITY_DN205_c0_g1~~TRINITY_DN205_c0_g1_i3.p1  ORF type:complete len:227 (+),score=32.28 TRINITY_DN205_c0_g1_i3:2-682(+)